MFFFQTCINLVLEIYYLNFAEILGFKKPRISKLCKFPDRKLRGSPVVGQLIVPKWTFPCCLQPEGTRGVVNDLNNVFECKKLVFGHKTQKFIILIWYWVYWDGIGWYWVYWDSIGMVLGVIGWYWVFSVTLKTQYHPIHQIPPNIIPIPSQYTQFFWIFCFSALDVLGWYWVVFGVLGGIGCIGWYWVVLVGIGFLV